MKGHVEPADMISPTDVIASVAAVNGIPNRAAAFASSNSPPNHTNPANAVGATTIDAL